MTTPSQVSAANPRGDRSRYKTEHANGKAINWGSATDTRRRRQVARYRRDWHRLRVRVERARRVSVTLLAVAGNKHAVLGQGVVLHVTIIHVERVNG